MIVTIDMEMCGEVQPQDNMPKSSEDNSIPIK